MKTIVPKFVVLSFVVYGLFAQEFLTISGNNLTLNGEKVFLSGMNQAWHSYGQDFGLNFYDKSRPFLLKTLDNIQKSGGNSISKFTSSSLVNHRKKSVRLQGVWVIGTVQTATFDRIGLPVQVRRIITVKFRY